MLPILQCMMCAFRSQENNLLPQPPSVPRENVNYDGENAKTAGKGIKGGTMTDSRRRIAQAIGRP